MHGTVRRGFTVAAFATVSMCLSGVSAPDSAAWSRVTEAIEKGRPKTAIELLQPMIDRALADKAYPDAVKALAYRIKLEGDIEGRKPEERIARLEREVGAAPAAMKPVFQTVLGHWYWQYFQQNRWRFMQRTQSGTAAGADLLTWDLARILQEIDARFQTALAEASALQRIPIADWDALLEKGSVPDAFRPTLYDFLAQEALTFYQAGEQAGAKHEDAFELEAGMPVFDDADAFLQWTPASSDEQSPTLKALRLYRQILSFHRADKDVSAFIDADLARLAFANNTAVGETKAIRYKAALERFVNANADHRISARALAAWAGVLHAENDLVGAHRLASRGATLFPGTPGGNLCHNLIRQIEAKASQVSAERVWNAPWPDIAVRYSNLTNLYLRVVPYDWNKQLAANNWNPEDLDQGQRKALLNATPAKAWNVVLPTTEDYRERQEWIPAPDGLAPGFYYLVSSHAPGFGEHDNVVSFTGFWVSDLAVVMRTAHDANEISGLVLNAAGGDPIAGATVQSWIATRGKRASGPGATTDANGLFRLTLPEHTACLLLVEHQGHRLSTAQFGSGRRHVVQPSTQTVFFTDRSLYRPGQTIQYKGLCIRVDQEADNYRVLDGQDVIVIFADVNGKEIARQTHRANDYGSFAGSFTAPGDRLMGQMQIRSERDPHGQTFVAVEEYKRPKFKVTLDAPDAAPRLDDAVTMTGHATAYTGAAVDGAHVRYRVVREVRFPDWWFWRCWWYPPNQGESREIAHGALETAQDGSFSVTFKALADRSVDRESEPTFRYTLHADVTDGAGETRSGSRSVNVGYTALSASLSAADWQQQGTPVAITIATRTLDGDAQAATGHIKIHALRQPANAQRAKLPSPQAYGRDPFLADRSGALPPPDPDPANPNSWELGDVVFEQDVTTSADGTAMLSVDLKAGIYRAILATQDRFKTEVKALLPIQVVDIAGKRFPIKVPNAVSASAWSLEPGGTFLALWGTGYEKGRAYVEIEHRGRLVRGFWTAVDATQEIVEHAVDERMRGGFTLHITQVRENRAYLTSRRIDVPWTNKQLQIKWERFVSKLEPAQKETWTAVITGPDANKAAAELTATLYDESLDAYRPHAWMPSFGVFRQDDSHRLTTFENALRGLDHLHGSWPVDYRDVSFTYRAFPAELTAQHMLWGYPQCLRWSMGKGMSGRSMMAFSGGANRVAGAEIDAMPAMAMAAGIAPGAAVEPSNRALAADKSMETGGAGSDTADPFAASAAPDLSQVSARKNLQETAFFFPQLLSDADGIVRMQFTMPEALTQWKFMGFAHDRELRSGYLRDAVVTAKDLMVQPNPPRFLREGDALEFTVKVVNQSPTRQEGTVRLTFADARTLQAVDDRLQSKVSDLKFDIPPKESRSFAWRLQVPDGMGFLQYKTVAATTRMSDGEEGYLPVLPRRTLVTESMTLPIRDAGTKQFTFTKLGASGASDTLRHHKLVVQMVSNPSWYAIMALPYLMEYPHGCSEQVFNRLYANALARHIATSQPKIRRIFDQWRGTEALDSPLEKNQDLKSVMLEETPWQAEGEDESAARRNVGILFDANRLDAEADNTMRKLAQMQLDDGAWPWFPGGEASDHITLYITTGYGRLRHLGVNAIDMRPAVKSLNRLDAWVDGIYRDILKHGRRDDNNLTSTIALYLYGRSFFLKEQAIAPAHKEAIDYFLAQAAKHWVKLPRQSQGHLALALTRFGTAATTPNDIMASLKEFSVTSEEMGMFWRDTEYSWWWYRAPIETQAIMIEAFDEVAKDARAVEDCKVWLLKQKQTQDWKTTKATADAVYALLLRGSDLLASDELVAVSLAGRKIEPEKVEAGTGFYEKRLGAGDIVPAMSAIAVTKVDAGVAWGGVHWQYFEDMSRIVPHEATPLTLQKSLFVKANTKKGPELTPVTGAVAVGDELVTRLVLRVDRDMEYVHMKDQRGSGTEPVNVLSAYKYQDGLRYYESTKDTASHFFIDYLPKGTYVFEYSVRVQHRGAYQSGMALIECLYAPEFNSHSASFQLLVK